MNPRSLGNFLKSKFGLFLVFVVVLFTGLWLYGKHQAEEREAAKLAAQNAKNIELGQVKMPLNQGLENGVPQQVKPATGTEVETKQTPGDIVPFRPTSPMAGSPAATASPAGAKRGTASAAAPRGQKIRYASLLANYEVPPAETESEKQRPPERFLPFGTLMKCKLINTIDSANAETPVIALLMEDVWQNGKLILPANTLVHGTAQAGRLRDRITASGSWRLVWQDGRELAFNGVALDREYDQDIDGYGITDGSGGIKGRILASDDMQELKLLAAAALSGFAQGTQDRQQSVLGTTITGSVSNGVRQGAGAVFDLYAARVLKDIEENGYYVRVAAGKEFYVYVLESIEPQKASFAGMRPRPGTAAAESSEVQVSLSGSTKG